MKFLVVLSVLVAVGVCKPMGGGRVDVRQDTHGNYKLDIDLEGYRKQEVRKADGSVVGGYSYVDANGVVQNIQYEAGEQGFRVVGGNLPVAPLPIPETPEVLAARAQHFRLLQHAASQ